MHIRIHVYIYLFISFRTFFRVSCLHLYLKQYLNDCEKKETLRLCNNDSLFTLNMSNEQLLRLVVTL